MTIKVTILSCFHPRFLLDAPSTVRTMAEAKFLILLTLAFCLLHLAHNSPTGLDGFGSFGEFLHGIGVFTHLCDEQCVFSRFDRNSDG